MERLTGNQAKSLMEAYAQVYLPSQSKKQLLSEQQTKLPSWLNGMSIDEFNKKNLEKYKSGEYFPPLKPGETPYSRQLDLDRRDVEKFGSTTSASGEPAAQVRARTTASTTPPAKKYTVGTTAGGTKFERRLPTMAELKAAQAARAAALKAGKTKSEAEESAVKAGVLKGTTSTAASNLSGRGAITPPNGGKSATSTGSVQGSSLRQEIDAVRNQIQQRDLTSQQSNLIPGNSKGPVRIQQVPFDPNRQKIKDDVDLFDIVKGHFIEEGYSEEDTMYMMANLDENALMKYIINPIVQAGKPILKRGLQQGLRQVGRMFGRTPASTRVPSGQVGALRLYQDKANQSLQRLNQQSTRLNANDATRAATRETNRLNNLDPRTVGRNNSRREVEQIRQRNRELGRPEWAPPQPVDSLNYRPGDPKFTRSLRDYYADKRSGVKGLD